VWSALTQPPPPCRSEVLEFPEALPALRPVDVEDVLRPYCDKLVSNNRNTQHLPSLVLHTAKLLQGVNHATKELPRKAINAVALTTVFIKHYVERVRVEALTELCEVPPPEGGSGAGGGTPVVRTLLTAVLTVLTAHRPTPQTYLLHLTALRLLTVMAATQLTQPMTEEGHGAHPFLDALLATCATMPAAAAAAGAKAGAAASAGGGKGLEWSNNASVGSGDGAAQLVRVLLGHYVERAPPPPRLALYSLQAPSKSLLTRLTAATTNVFLLPVHVYNMFVKQAKTAGDSPAPLADAAVLVLLILIHYSPGAARDSDDHGASAAATAAAAAAGYPAAGAGGLQPFRAALHGCRDAGYDPAVLGSGGAPGGEVADAEGGFGHATEFGGPIRVKFAELFDTLGLCLVDDRSTLVLYSLLHGNGSVLEYFLAGAYTRSLLSST